MIEKYKNSDFPVEERVGDLLSRMTLEEKVGQMIQLDGGNDPETWVKKRNIGSYLNLDWKSCQKIQKMALNETRLGIPIIFGVDATHGHGFGHENATIFPTQLALSCSWNPELIQQTASVTAREVIQTGHHWTFSPVVDLARDPRWGRTNETFGEDPFLVGCFAAAKIRGYQGNKLSDPSSILACPKHFAAYGESHGGRDSAEVFVSKRMLKSIFLPPFQKAIQDAGAGSIMAAYHAIDGIPCSANPWLLQGILKEQWKFEGFVVTDWKNLNWMHELQFTADSLEEAMAIGLKSGNDMIMSTPEFYEYIIAMVREGRLSEDLVNHAVTRILRMKFKLGLFDGKALRDNPPDLNIIGCKKHRDLALKAALQSIVLLKNKDDLLPLNENKLSQIAVIGPNADYWVSQLGDWAFKTGNMQQDTVLLKTREHEKGTVTILKGIENRVKGKANVVYSKGCHITDVNNKNINAAVKLAKDSDVIIVVLGDTHGLNGERKDRATLELPGAQLDLLKALKSTEKPLVCVLINGKPLNISWLAEYADAILEAFNPGCEGGNAVAQILFGDFNPSGKLTISFPKSVGQIPVYYNQIPGWHSGRYIDLDSRYQDGGVAVPLFPFGFGLSYTHFEYSNLKLSSHSITESGLLDISIDLQNIGDRSGTEIVQLYVNDKYSSVTTPVMELKAFQRVKLAPKEKKKINFRLNASDLTIITSDLNSVVEKGKFEVFIGSSSNKEDLKSEIFTIE